VKSEQLLIIGCGDIGIRVGLKWLDCGGSVSALRRNVSALPHGFAPLEGDYTLDAGLHALRDLSPDYILFTPLPAGRDPAGYQRGYAEAVGRIAHQGVFDCVKAAVMVSSTRVYAEQQGVWVDESAELTKTDDAALAIIEAEKRFLAVTPNQRGVVLRASGIYGSALNNPNMGMLLQRVSRGERAADPTRMSNRIHRDDLARAVTFAFERSTSNAALNGIYNCSDSEPAPIGEVETWLAQQLDLAVSPRDRTKASISVRGNRRVANQRLLATGFELTYSTYRDGYAEVLSGIPRPLSDVACRGSDA